MKKDINVVELKKAIGEEGIKNLLFYIQDKIKKGIEDNIEKVNTIDIKEYL